MHTIDLKKPRIIVIADRGHNYTLTILPVSKKHWLKYFEGIVSTSENLNGRRVDSFDSTGARLALVNETLIDADGYKVTGDGRIFDLSGWKDLIPANHRIAAGNVLISVERSTTDDADPITLGCESVRLDAVWGRSGRSSMLKVTGLRHNFTMPSVEQQRRYSRDMSRSQVIGGSRNGKTRWLGAQSTLADLYDELILSVEGYTADGEPLGDNRDEIVACMDTYHKVAAAEALFTPVAAAVEDADADA